MSTDRNTDVARRWKNSADFELGRQAAMAEVYKGLDYIKQQLVMMHDQRTAEGAGLGVGLVRLKLAEIEYGWRIEASNHSQV